MILSIVIPIYNEESLIKSLFQELLEAIKGISLDIEILVVNDGSHDKTLNILKSYLGKISCLKIIDLSRNFGHQAAYMAGLSIAQGDAVVMLDGDLQDPPAIIPQLVQKWQEGYEVVVAARKSRKDNFLRNLLFVIFHKLFSFLSDYPMPIHTGMYCLINKRVCMELVNLNERNRFIPGLREWLGFKTIFVWYDRDRRLQGKPKQTISKLFKLACDAIFSFSYKPLRISLFFGFFISFLSFSYGLILTIQRLLKIDYVKGFTTPTVAILFLSGVILISIGIMGEYLGRIYDEVKRRPHFIISEVITQNKR